MNEFLEVVYIYDLYFQLLDLPATIQMSDL